MEEADVLIVGGGPVGLTLAADLSFREVKSILIEKRPTTSASPKAFALSSRSMEHFRRIGLQEKIMAASYPREFPVVMCLSTGLVNGNVMFKRTFSSWGDFEDGNGEGEFPFFQGGASVAFPMLCPQFTSEAVIRKHIENTSEHARLFWGWSVTTINQDDTGVTVKAVNQDGEEKTFRGRYLAACDGGRSFVHKALAVHTFGQFVVARACTLAFSSPQLMEHMVATKITGFAVIINPHLTCLTILLNREGQFAAHIIMAPDTSDDEVEWHVKNPNKIIERIMGSSDIPYDVISVDGYNMHALVSTKFHEGRCYFVGDSAHQWLPAGGLGLNTGISDAGDVSWKLEAMVKGYGGEFLLDSYEIERRPLADSTRRFAMSLGATLIPNGTTKKISSFLTQTPIGRFFLGKFAGASFVAPFSQGIDLVLGFQYSSSNIVMHQYEEDGSVRLHCNTDNKFVPSSLPGCRAPHVVLPEYPSILDIFGKHFVLLTVGGTEADLKELREALTQKGVPFGAHTYPPLPELVALYDRKYFLIRPDGVVAWRSDFQPSNAESAKIVATALGHNPASRLPPPIETFRTPRTPAAQVLARVFTARVLVTEFLLKYAKLPLVSAGAVGFNVAMLLGSSTPVPYVQALSRHKAAIVREYGSAHNVLEIDPRYVGMFGPDDVVIRVRASSVNELDLLMRSGRGAVLYQRLARTLVGSGPYFPLILGRDCSGEVVAVGDSVTQYLPGDKVYAAIPPHRQGAHAQLVAVDEKHVAFKPSNVDHKEAASLPWVAMTVWTALVRDAGLNRLNTRGKKVLVHQGTGGVGSFAVQLLKAWGATVTTTCEVESTALAHHLGADKVVDDQTGDFSSVLSGYDVVLDTVGGLFERPSLSTLKLYRRSVYLSLVSPREKLVDSFGGLLGGLLFSSVYRCKVLFNRLFGGRAFYYSDTEIDAGALDEVRAMVEQGAIRPLINAVYSLDEMVDAHKHVEAGHTPGKVVISIA